jgi:hypothetical protein
MRVRLLDILKTSTKYGVYSTGEKPYLLIASKSNLLVTPNPYDFILTVTSRFPEKNEEVASDLAYKLNINLRPAPEELAIMMQGITLAFAEFEKVGSQATDFLKNLQRRRENN